MLYFRGLDGAPPSEMGARPKYGKILITWPDSSRTISLTTALRAILLSRGPLQDGSTTKMRQNSDTMAFSIGLGTAERSSRACFLWLKC